MGKQYPALGSSYALRAYLPNIIQYGMLRMDVPIIQVLAGTAAVAMYAVALPFAEALLLLPVTVGLVMFPQVTSGTVGKTATTRIGLTVLAATTVLAAAVALAVPVAVPVPHGLVFHGSVAVIWAMLPGLAIFSIARTVQTYLTGTDDLKPVIIASAAGAVTGLVSLFALTGGVGAVGAGAAELGRLRGFFRGHAGALARPRCVPRPRCGGFAIRRAAGDEFSRRGFR